MRKLSRGALMALLTLSSPLLGWGSQDCYSCEPDPCYDNCYDSCFSGFYGIYENVIVRPYFSYNYAYFLDEPSNFDGQQAVMFDWEYKYSPRFEIGWNSDCGPGARVRYWRFHNDTKLTATSADANISSWFADDSVGDDLGFEDGTRAKFKHKLDLDVVDFEASFVNCCWTYSAGGRYTCIDQKYNANQLEPDLVSFEAKHKFEGGGLTTAVEYFQPVWCGFSFFSKARASLLYGDSKFLAINEERTTVIKSKNKHDVIAAGELQVGIDWRYAICDVCTFVRFAIETQYWIGAGSGGPGDNAVYDEGNYQNSNPEDANLGFFGFNIALGVAF